MRLGRESGSYLQRQIDAVAQMHALKAAVTAAVFAVNHISVGVFAHARTAVRVGQGDDASVGDVGALHKADSLELGKGGQLGHRIVREVGAAAKINIAEPVAMCHEAFDRVVCYVPAVSEVEVMQILAEAR